MIEKDSQGRGWEIKYAIYMSDDLLEDDAVEECNQILSALFKRGVIVDWDGPL